MLAVRRFFIGVLAIVAAVGLFFAINYAVEKAHTAFTSRGVHARIQARMENDRRERAAPAVERDSARERP